MTEVVEVSLQNSKRKLPDGWRWVRLEDVVTPHNGYWGQDTPFPGSIKATVLGVSNITNEGQITLQGSQERFLSPRETEGIVFDGDLLVVKSSGSATNIRSGKTGLCAGELSGKIACSNFMIRLTVRKDLAEPYLLWLILNSDSGKSFVRLIAGSTTYPNIKWSSYKDFTFPLPSLSEQKRIAAILNEQMAAAERARAAAEAEMEVAKVLPAAYLRAVFNSPETQRWPKVRLGEILELRKDVVHPRDNPRGAATFVGLEHLESGTGVRTGSVDVEMAELTGRKPRFYKGDIVYGYLRPYLNKVWVTEFDGLCSVDQYVYKVDEKKVETDFVAWFMRSPLYLKRAPIKTTPGQLPRIRTEEVASVEVNLPPLPEQRRVMAVLTEQLTAAEQTHRAVEQQLDTINKLPAALLRRAFVGLL